MKLMILGTVAFAFASMNLVSPVVAGELDRAVGAAPQGLIVRVNESGAREIFKAELPAKVASDASAQAAVESFVKEENRVDQAVPGTELDRSTSSEAWYYWYNPSYLGRYSYSYWNYSYSWNYYPCYNYNWAGYSYYYYYWR